MHGVNGHFLVTSGTWHGQHDDTFTAALFEAHAQRKRSLSFTSDSQTHVKQLFRVNPRVW